MKGQLRAWYPSYLSFSTLACNSCVHRVAREADLEKKVTPHVLQHTYGTSIGSRWATPQYIRQTMGHSDLSSANPYLKYDRAQLDAEAEDLWG